MSIEIDASKRASVGPKMTVSELRGAQVEVSTLWCLVGGVHVEVSNLRCLDLGVQGEVSMEEASPPLQVQSIGE
jgi:hypothetical protein